MLDQPVDLLASFHGMKIEKLHNRPRFCQLGSVVRRWCKLLNVLPPHTSSRLLAPDDRAVAKITFHEKDHFLVTHEHLVSTNDVQPSLYRGFDAGLILLGAHASRGDSRGNGGYEGLRVRRDQMFLQLHEFGVETPDIAELGGAELGKVRLHSIMLSKMLLGSGTVSLT